MKRKILWKIVLTPSVCALFVMTLGFLGTCLTVTIVNKVAQDAQKGNQKRVNQVAIDAVMPQKPRVASAASRSETRSDVNRQQKLRPKLDPSIPKGESFGLDKFAWFDSNELGGSGNKMIDTDVMTADTVDQAPVLVGEGELIYPAAAQARGITGRVLVSLLVNTTGEVKQVQVLESEPADIFDTEAIRYANSLKFMPARYRGKATQVWAQKQLNFRLE